MKRIAIAAAILAVLAALSFTGNGDYEEAKAGETAYCERVAAGHHRDWNDRIDCK